MGEKVSNCGCKDGLFDGDVDFDNGIDGFNVVVADGAFNIGRTVRTVTDIEGTWLGADEAAWP